MNVREKKFLHGKEWSYSKTKNSSENGMQNCTTREHAKLQILNVIKIRITHWAVLLLRNPLSDFTIILGWLLFYFWVRDMGKNLVSDGHFCKSFCPAQPKISISSDLKHYYHLLAYPDWVMSEIHDLLQNRILRNQLLMAASVMEFPSTTLKNVPVEKILLQN